jgi:hypothetical protein
MADLSNKIVSPSSSTTNVSSLTPDKGALNVIKQTDPKTFGDQALKAGASVAVAYAIISPLAKLYKQKADLVKEGIQLDLKHQQNLLYLQQQNTPAKKVINGKTIDIPPKLDDVQYQKAVENENKNYDEAKKNLQEKKDKNQKDIDDYLKDPFRKQKDALKKRKDNRKKAKSRTKAEKRKALANKAKAIAKGLVPIVSLLLTNAIAGVIAQNDTISKLVNDTNDIITAANATNSPVQLQNAKLARDNAIRIITNNEERINNIQSQIQQISTYISIFSIIVSILSSIPIPTSVPPGIGIPVSLIVQIVKVLEKANKIILALSAFLPAILISLQKAIDILENYKSQLLDINGQLDSAASNIPNLNNLLGIGNSSSYPPYKGFTFAIKEENNPKFVVAGNKRHYAVAYDKQSVPTLQSDYSFTLDPNELIGQLKLQIDQQNLQG